MFTGLFRLFKVVCADDNKRGRILLLRNICYRLFHSRMV